MTRSLTAALFIALALMPPSAHATPESVVPPAPATNPLWIHADIGLTSFDRLTLADTTLSATSTPGWTLSLGATWQTGPFDLGLTLFALSAFASDALPAPHSVGSHLLAAADLRWRPLDAAWGSLILRLTPGILALAHAPPLVALASDLAATTPSLVNHHNVGFGIGADLGAQLTLSPRTALTFRVGALAGTTTLSAGGRELAIFLIRGLFSVGVSWAP